VGHHLGVATSGKPRLRTVLVAVGALVVLGLAIVYGVLLLRDGQPATAQQAAEAYVKAYNARDTDALQEVLCVPQQAGAAFLVRAGERNGAQVRLLGPVQQAGDMGRARVALLDGGVDTGRRFTVDLHLGAQSWTVCSSL